MKQKMSKEDKAILDCYIQLYKHSEPSADFEQLMYDAPINSRGQKVIDFMSYEIESNMYDQIVSDIIKKYKFKGFMVQAFKNTIALGCSPKTKNRK